MDIESSSSESLSHSYSIDEINLDFNPDEILTNTAEVEKRHHYRKINSYIFNKIFVFVLIVIMFLLAGLFFSLFNIYMTKTGFDKSTCGEVNISNIFYVGCAFYVLYKVFEIFFRKLTSIALETENPSYWFIYGYEMADYIARFVVSSLIFLFLKKYDFYMITVFNIPLQYYDCLELGCILIISFIFKQILVKYLYFMYIVNANIEEIKILIGQHYFIRALYHLNNIFKKSDKGLSNRSMKNITSIFEEWRKYKCLNYLCSPVNENFFDRYMPKERRENEIIEIENRSETEGRIEPVKQNIKFSERILIIRRFYDIIEDEYRSIENEEKYTRILQNNIYKYKNAFNYIKSTFYSDIIEEHRFLRDTYFLTLYSYWDVSFHNRKKIPETDIEFFHGKLRNTILNINNMIRSINNLDIVLCYIIIFYTMAITFCKIYNDNKAGDSTSSKVVSLFTFLFGGSFIFKDIIGSAVESCIFLFAIHPYDIGDRIFVEIDGQQENLIVLEMNIYSTVFKKFDGTYTTISNQILLKRQITNVRRSGNMAESFYFHVDVNTDFTKLKLIKADLETFLKSNPNIFKDYYMNNIEKITEGNKLYMKVFVLFNGNFQDYNRYLVNRNKFLIFMNELFKKRKITYYKPIQRIEMVDGKRMFNN